MKQISVQHLSKSFRPKSEIWTGPKQDPVFVLRDVSLELGEGEIVCLLGRNGAGKTTLIRIISTLIEPDGGEVRVCGFDVVKNGREVRSRLGVMLNAGDGGFKFRLSPIGNLEYFAVLYQIPLSKARIRIKSLLEELGLGDRERDQYQSYSSGMRRRLALARALLPDPPVLLLDEPTIGVDPWSIRLIHEKLKELARTGKTILCTSNNPVEARELGQRTCVLENGKISDARNVRVELA